VKSQVLLISHHPPSSTPSVQPSNSPFREKPGSFNISPPAIINSISSAQQLTFPCNRQFPQAHCQLADYSAQLPISPATNQSLSLSFSLPSSVSLFLSLPLSPFLSTSLYLSLSISLSPSVSEEEEEEEEEDNPFRSREKPGSVCSTSVDQFFVPKALHISQGNNQQGLVLLSITLFFWLIIRPLD
jgi:hypothetical protein